METAVWFAVWTLAPDLLPNKKENTEDHDDTQLEYPSAVLTTEAGHGMAHGDVIKTTSSHGLRDVLAKADSNVLENHEGDTGSLTASITAASLDTFLVDTFKPADVAPAVRTVSFTDAEKAMLMSVTTPIDNYVHFTKTDSHYVPLLEARGGSDKDPVTGHRRDSVPIASKIAAQSQCASGVLHYLEDAGDDAQAEEARRINALMRQFLLQTATGVVVRVNPGTLSAATQSSLDTFLTELADAGIQVMTAPRAVRQMGAKDSLVKIRNLRCGLPDTYVFYDADSFIEGFCKSIAFRPRVIKQNRGSQGEGIWIVKLKDEPYCQEFGERSASLDTELELVEANDNHVEYHTVGEFLEFCINGRTDKSGEWQSTGNGRYLEGGVEAGAMLVDQRFLPRIVEGEVRCNMIGSTLVNLVHKVPQAGALSCTLQSGADYTSYDPDHPKFAKLVEAFYEDLPKIMAAFDMAGEPLPLLWTADFIFDTAPDGTDVFYVGEFNCSCVGITKDLHLAEQVAQTAVATCGLVYDNNGATQLIDV